MISKVLWKNVFLTLINFRSIMVVRYKFDFIEQLFYIIHMYKILQNVATIQTTTYTLLNDFQ